MKKLFALAAMALTVMAAGCGHAPQPREGNPMALDTNAIKREAETYLTEDKLRPLIGDSGTMPSKYQLKLFDEGGTDTVEVHGRVVEDGVVH